MKTVVNFDFGGPTIQHIGLTPRTLMKREYSSRSEAYIPVVGEQVLIQWGEDAAQSNYFHVDSISHELWAGYDSVSVKVSYKG
ncbi:hypothetical protein [Pseudomonas aeruginosa]|uniref:hypothetical protein n=1 Tax=Pseudomonas aeruginosa TaxID=287 RepID=UPI00106AECA5|nr:hypothetical protein [Pseudomonas aeruginosa]